jgi:competence protein ComEA
VIGMDLEKIRKKIFKYWKLLLFVIFILIVLIIYGIHYYYNLNKTEEVKGVIMEKTKIEINDNKEKVIEKITIDIKGAVKNPGVYEIELGKRVNDAINLAGGLKSAADISVINLSKKLKDEMVIIIYTKEEIKKMLEGDTVIKVIEKECVCPKLENDACVEDKITNEKTDVSVDESKREELVSINTASINELTSISGIGESKAKAIIEYREKNGDFEKIEDVKNVSGIGESLFEKIKDYITI